MACTPLLVVVFLFTVSPFVPTDGQQPPNIFLVLVDDWGWANVGYHRHPSTREVDTPNIDHLCKEAGIELDNFYAHAVCGPSRASLMSGRFTIHVSVDNGDVTMNNPDNTLDGYAGIPPPMTGIGEKLQKAGYVTHQVGKWDAGMVIPEQIPVSKGFNSSYGFFHHGGDYYTYKTSHCPNLNITGKQIRDFWDTDQPANVDVDEETYVEILYRERMEDIIHNHDSSQPLFLYYSPHLVHTPLQVPEEYVNQFLFIEDEDRRIYAAMTKLLDVNIGAVVEALNTSGLWDNTLMVMASDNGGPIYAGGGANNYPLRGGKRSNFQGGIRVNAFASGGYLPEEVRGTKKTGLMALCDLYTTFCSLANVPSFDTRAYQAGLPPVDGLDMSGYLLDPSSSADSPRHEVYIGQHIKDGVNQTTGIGSGIIFDQWKYIQGEVLYPVWTGPRFPNLTGEPVLPNMPGHDCTQIGCLFNIQHDPEEYHDLASLPGFVNILYEMQEKWNDMMSTMYLPDRGTADTDRACNVGLHYYGGFYGPFRESGGFR